MSMIMAAAIYMNRVALPICGAAVIALLVLA
jgi:hypothetical protein